MATANRKFSYENAKVYFKNSVDPILTTVWNKSKTGYCVHFLDQEPQTNIGDIIQITTYSNSHNAKVIWITGKNIGVEICIENEKRNLNMEEKNETQ